MWNKYACVRQQGTRDCGIAVLATISKHYGRTLNLGLLRELSGTDQFGANLQGLQAAAIKLGFSARAVKGTWEALRSLPAPIVAHWKLPDGSGHFVAVHKIDEQRVIVADPAIGIRVLTPDQFQSLWSGYLLLVVPDADRPMDFPTTQSTSPSARLWGLVLAQRGLLLELFCCTIVMTVLGISSAYFVQQLIDSVLSGRQSQLLNALGFAMLAILFFRIALSVVRQYLQAHLGRCIELMLMSRFIRHLLKLPHEYFSAHPTGEIISRVHDTAKVREVLTGTALTVMVDGTLVAFTSVILWLYDIQLALVATLFAPLMMAAVALHHPLARRFSRDAMDASARLSGHLVESIAGVSTVKAYCAQDRCATESEFRLVRMARATFALQMLRMSMSTAGTLITAVAGLVTLWLGGHRVLDGALSIGELMFFYTLLGYMLDPMERLAGVNLQLQDALVATDRLYKVIDMPTEDESLGKGHFLRVRESIRLSNVSFRYGYRKPVLDQLDLTIPAGRTLAIVGTSGCGKSTLLKLLMRLHEPTEGSILIDGVDSRDYDLHSLRSRIGLVSQEALIFSGTLRENIAYSRPEASFEEIMAAAKSAGLTEWIASLPNRYDTLIGESGNNLSGGQRQRVAIARALLRDPEILIFDEATSHLDARTESLIQHNLKQAFQQRTVILVAHRLSTIRSADLICVLDAGRVAEMGTHAELMKLDGHYAQLWHSQAADARELINY